MTDEVDPPWAVYPHSEPWWGGWRQGRSEAWLHEVWLPFWRGRTPAERDAYLKRRPPPTEEWRAYLLERWG